MDRIVFIHHLLVDTGGFHLLTIVNNAAMNTESLLSTPLGSYLGVELLSHTVIL